MRYKVLIPLASGLLVGALILSSATPVLAGNWTPNGAEVFAVSTDITITTTNFDVNCIVSSLEGMLGANTNTWAGTPTFAGCTRKIAGGRAVSTVTPVGNWNALSVNATTANLVLPAATRLELEMSPTCTIKIDPQTIGGMYVAGLNGRNRASVWLFLNPIVNITQSVANCASNNNTAMVLGAYLMTNITTRNTPILAN